MIQYYRGTEQDMEVLFSAFQAGFIDYMIKFELSLEQFAAHFFGPEGNAREHSFVAMRGEEPMGLILGGMKQYEGVQTMRCGTLAVKPDLRGQGVSRELFRLHQEEAVQQGCRQLYLEVIVGNDRAISFYNKLGYQRRYDLNYYTLNAASGLEMPPLQEALQDSALTIGQLDKEQFIEALQDREDFHLNWQNDLDYITWSDRSLFYGGRVNGRSVAAMAITPQGRISLLTVNEDYRNRGIARRLLAAAIRELALTRLQISFSSNDALQGFLQRLGFQKDSIQQYEMYKFL